MAEGARLESVYTLIAYRGFESLPLRQYETPAEMLGFFYFYSSSLISPQLLKLTSVKPVLVSITYPALLNYMA